MKLFDIFKKSDRRTDKRKIGDKGEELAVKYLKEKQYVVKARNWRFGKNEIDIVAWKNGVYVFVEVKTTASDYAESFKLPGSAVDYEKQKNIISAARVYMGKVYAYEDAIIQKNLYYSYDTRFDVIEVYLNRDTPEINHIENAFYVEKGNKRKWKT